MSEIQRIKICAFITFWIQFSSSIAQVSFQNQTDKLTKDPALKHGSVGLCIMHLESGKIMAQNNADMAHIPASSLKSITTGVAMKILGNDFVFQTEFGYKGKIIDSALQGDFIIKGYGDPTFGSPIFKGNDLKDAFKQLALSIRKAGIKVIKGRILVDDSYFDSQGIPTTWSWADLGNYYAAGVWGINVHENLYYLDLQQTPVLKDTPAVIKTRPFIPNLSIINELTSAGKNTGDRAYLYGGSYQNTRYLRGTIPVGNSIFTIKGSIPDPPLYFGYRVKNYLDSSGIEIEANVQRLKIPNDSIQTIHTHTSKPLSDIVTNTLHRSVNLYCEALVKTLGAKSLHSGTAAAGLRVVEGYLSSAGVDTKAMFLMDGSGLSAKNALSPESMASSLKALYSEDFLKTFPQAGKSGNLRRKFRGTAAVGNLWLKSGTISRVSAYAGYAEIQGEKYVIVLMANNFTCSGYAMRKKLDDFVESLF